MVSLSRARLARAILDRYNGAAHPFLALPEEQLPAASQEIVGAARDLLLTQIAKMLDELAALGFSNKEVSDSLDFDKSEISRAHGGGKGLSMGLDKMQRLMEKLCAFLPDARFSRLKTATSQAELRPVDYCWSGEVTEQQERDIVAVVHHNVIAGLSGKANRKNLPQPFGGAFLTLGPPSNRTWVIQGEGASEIEQRANFLHELEHYIEREQAELERLRSQESNNAYTKTRQRPSAF